MERGGGVRKLMSYICIWVDKGVTSMLASIRDLAIMGVIFLLFLIVAITALVRWIKRIAHIRKYELLDLEHALEQMQREVPNYAAALVIIDVAVGIIFRTKISQLLLEGIGVVNIVYLVVLLVGIVGWKLMSRRWQKIQEQLPIQEIRAQMSMQAQMGEQDMGLQQPWQALPAPMQGSNGQVDASQGMWPNGAVPEAHNQWPTGGQMAMPQGQWQGQQEFDQQNQWQATPMPSWQQNGSGQNW